MLFIYVTDTFVEFTEIFLIFIKFPNLYKTFINAYKIYYVLCANFIELYLHIIYIKYSKCSLFSLAFIQYKIYI